MNEQVDFPDNYTFSQRYGYEPFPDAIKLEVLSKDLRRELCNVFVTLVDGFRDRNHNDFFRAPGERLFRSVLGKFEGIPDHRVNTYIPELLDKTDDLFINSPCHKVLSFLEILLGQTNFQNSSDQSKFAEKIQVLFSKNASAYRLDIDQCWFYPCESEEHAKAIMEALETLKNSDFRSAQKHLREATEFINKGQHGNAIRESIHAVESVAKKIEPNSSTLAPALKSLQKRGLLNHNALRQSFENLYGYTSDEEGIRHALVSNDEANVGLDESVFMFGACTAFAGYLVRKYNSYKYA